MKGIFRIFFGAEGTRPAIVLTCLVLAGLAEAAGLSTVLPVVTELAGGAQDQSSPLNDIVRQTVSAIGLEPTLGTLMALVAILITLKAILSFAALSYVGYAMANVATGLRASLIGHLMNARWSYFGGSRTGRIANSISVDATRSGKAYLNAAKFVAHGLQAVVYLVVALFVSWKLALGGLIVGGLMAWSLSSLVRTSKKAGRKQTYRTAELVTYLTDTLSNIKPLRAMGRESSFTRLLARKIKDLKKALRRQVIATQGRYYGEEIIVTVSLAAGVYFAAVVWNIPLSEIFVLGLIFFQVVSIVGKMQKMLQAAVEVESAYWSIKKLISDTASQPEDNPGTVVPTLDRGCRFENVRFDYPERPVLSGIDLDITPNAITVLKGPSGSGKTTIVDLLVGLHRPTEGEIFIDGTPLSQIDLKAWRAMIGYVPQEPGLFHDTVLANIILGDEDYDEKDLDRALAASGVDRFIHQMPEGLETFVGERGTKLSGGQRQRIAIARALFRNPRLLILDEVTSALDPDTEAKICEQIRALSADHTILVITHRPAWIDIATTLYEVEMGRLKPVTGEASAPSATAAS